jgi:peptide-methionine (R)-S-oxide reductase
MPLSRRSFVAAVASLVVAPAGLALEDVLIVEFAEDGKRLGARRVPKVVKTEAEWRRLLSPRSFEITRHAGTEVPFTGAFWNFHERGIFRCICCDSALFDSATKFDSGTGWPSFWDKIAPENVVTHPSRSRRWVESEVTCTRCDAHLGDVFSDGPKPTGLRYCIDSVALRFAKLA